MTDAMGDAGKVRMAGDCKDFGAVGTLGVKHFKGIECALVEHSGALMLERHQHNVVLLEIIRERDDGAGRRPQCDRLIVKYPIANILDPGLSEIVDGLVGLCEPWAKPPPRTLAREAFKRIDCLDNGGALIGKLLHRYLLDAVSIELPSFL